MVSAVSVQRLQFVLGVLWYPGGVISVVPSSCGHRQISCCTPSTATHRISCCDDGWAGGVCAPLRAWLTPSALRSVFEWIPRGLSRYELHALAGMYGCYGFVDGWTVGAYVYLCTVAPGYFVLRPGGWMVLNMPVDFDPLHL